MKTFMKGLAAVVCLLGLGYAICLLVNYDELIRPCPPCPEERGAVVVDSLEVAPQDTVQPSYWDLKNLPFVDSLVIWTRAGTITINGHFFKRPVNGVRVEQTAEQIEEMVRFVRHREILNPTTTIFIDGSKP